ncbi:MAG: hypothetical protein P1V18_04915 [Candidatus Gracilibacteria bacterium]|nr:hypothetical protein [Candidatus Gracilibacteria bacterium]
MSPELLNQIQEIEELMNLGEMDEAIALLMKYISQNPKNYHLISLLGECHLSNGEPEKAIRPLLWATKNHPKSQDELQEKPIKESEDNLVNQLRRSVGKASLDGSWVDHYLLGCAYGRCMKYLQGTKHLNIADKMNPNNSEIIRNIGWIKCMNKNTPIGRKLLRRAINIDANNALAHNDMGASYLFEGKIYEAGEWINKAIKLDPDDPFIKTTAEKLEELQAYSTLFGEKPITTPQEFLQE